MDHLATLKTVQAWLLTQPSFGDVSSTLAEETSGKARATVLRALRDHLDALEVGRLAGQLADLTASGAEPVSAASTPPAESAAPEPASAPADRGQVRYAWYEKEGLGRRLAISFLNEQDVAEFGPNLELSPEEAKKRGWSFGPASGEGSIHHVDTTSEPFHPGLLRGLSGAQLWGPRYGQVRSKE